MGKLVQESPQDLEITEVQVPQLVQLPGIADLPGVEFLIRKLKTISGLPRLYTGSAVPGSGTSRGNCTFSSLEVLWAFFHQFTC